MKKNKVTIGKVFTTIVWPRRNTILIGLVLIVFSTLSSLVLPASIKYVVDDVFKNRDMEKLKLIVGAVMIAITIQATTGFLLTRILSVEAQHLISILRAQVQRQILRLPI